MFRVPGFIDAPKVLCLQNLIHLKLGLISGYRRHCTTRFSEDVLVVETSNVRSFSILRSGEGLTSSNKNNSANSSGKYKCNEEF